jgi:hypothetical protein
MDREPDKPLAAALRVARLVRGYSLERTAAGSGVPEWRLRAWERGNASPPPDEFIRVWDFLASAVRR